jgi:hypothetical protein
MQTPDLGPCSLATRFVEKRGPSMRRLLMGSLAFAVVASMAAATQAHIQLTSPAQRHPDQKAGPCGILNDTRGTAITYLEPGATISVQWDETVEHPGHFRIMFDEDGSDVPVPAAFDDSCTPGTSDMGVHCLADPIADQGGMPSYAQDVTLPNIECANCTLQVIQMMTDKPPYGDGNDIYYQCADLTLQMGAGGGPATTTSSTSGASSTGSGSSSGAGTGGAGNGIDVITEEDDSGCACRLGRGGDSAAAAVVAALGLLALGARGRKKRAGD